jgi:hypothetical protein
MREGNLTSVFNGVRSQSPRVRSSAFLHSVDLKRYLTPPPENPGSHSKCGQGYGWDPEKYTHVVICWRFPRAGGRCLWFHWESSCAVEGVRWIWTLRSDGDNDIGAASGDSLAEA